MRHSGYFTAEWKIAECGQPVIECKIPETVRRMRAEFRKHIAQRVRDCLLYVIPVDSGPYTGPDHGLIGIFWELKDGRIAACAEIPTGSPRPPIKVRKKVAFDFAAMLIETAPH